MRPLPALAVLASVLAPLGAGAAGAPWLCRRATTAGETSGAAGLPVATSDRFAARTVTLASPEAFCAPVHAADADGSGRMVAYALRADATDASRDAAGRATVSTPLGTLPLRVRALERILAPSPDDASTARRACWRVRGPRLTTAALRVAVIDAAGVERLVEVQRPERLCVADGPAPGDDALCFRARLARNVVPRPVRLPRDVVTVPTALATETLRLGSRLELCVAATTVAPGPTIALALEPPTIDLEPGERVAPRVTARFGDGRPDEDWSRRVGLRAADEGVAIGHASTAGAFVEGVGPGTTSLTAVDRSTGATSAPDGDAQATVHWDLVRITLDPPMSRRAPGGVESYTATGHFADGHTRNLTQRVVWSTTDPSVALAPNAPGRRSRVLAKKPGVVGVTARDPLSGLRTAHTGDDAVLRVTARVQWIEIGFEGWIPPSRFPGESKRFTAIGHLADGSTKNLTQRVRWTSSDPAVAVAPNAAGDASRIDAVAPGRTWIDCEDPETGLRCGTRVFHVNGALTALTLGRDPDHWSPGWPLMPDQERRYTAFAHYEGGGVRVVTQDVEWESLAPAILEVPNAAGDRSRVIARAGGLAPLVVRDPVTGIASDPRIVPVLGPLRAIALKLNGLPHRIGRGGRFGPIAARGIFTAPWGTDDQSFDLNRFAPDTWVLESSDPTIVSVAPDGKTLVGERVGTADVTALHLLTGVRSAPVPFTTTGPLAAIRVDPPTAVRGIGEREEFSGVGLYPPDLAMLLTQDLVWTSSDPNVVIVEDEPGRRSRVRAVGPGTATIRATDPHTGVSTHDTGGDATVTVVPGTLARIEITPAQRTIPEGAFHEFTATGHYPDGRTLNVTSQVAWYVRDTGVAQATNPRAHRSRIDGVAPGTTTVGARHPSGLDTADTGDGARVDVLPVVAMVLTVPHVQATVGVPTRLPRVKARLADGSLVPLQTALWLRFDDPGVAWGWWNPDDPDGLWFVPASPGRTGFTVGRWESDLEVRGTLTVVGEGSPAGAFVEAP